MSLLGEVPATLSLAHLLLTASSVLVIAMAATWLRALHSRGSLADALEELAQLSDKDCSGCCHNCCSGTCRGVLDNVRGLAIAAIVFGILELLTYVVVFSSLGINLFYSYENRAFSCSYSGKGSYGYQDVRVGPAVPEGARSGWHLTTPSLPTHPQVSTRLYTCNTYSQTF